MDDEYTFTYSERIIPPKDDREIPIWAVKMNSPELHHPVLQMFFPVKPTPEVRAFLERCARAYLEQIRNLM